MKTKRTKGKKEPEAFTVSFLLRGGGSPAVRESKGAGVAGLPVCPGARIREVATLNLGAGSTLKVLAREREKDGRLSVVVKVEGPGDRCVVFERDGWLTKESYERLVGALKTHLIDTVMRKSTERGQAREEGGD